MNRCAIRAWALALLSPASAAIADQTRNATANDLNLGAAWVSGTPPGGGDIALWDGSSALANTLGANLAWGGLNIGGAAGAVTIGGANSLLLAHTTLGSSTLDTGARNLTYNSSGNFDVGGGTFAGSSTVQIGGAGTKNWSTAGAGNSGVSSITFTGTLQLRGGSSSIETPGTTWLAMGTAGAVQTGSFALDTGDSSSRGDFIVTHAWDGRALIVNSLAGTGCIRSDWGVGAVLATRGLTVNQAVDTVFRGGIYCHNSGTQRRNLTITKQGSGKVTFVGRLGSSQATAGRPASLNFDIQGGTWEMGGWAGEDPSAHLNPANWDAASTFTIGPGGTLQFNSRHTSASGEYAWDRAITAGAGTDGRIRIVSSGVNIFDGTYGAVRFTADNSAFDGTVEIDGGRLALGHANALGGATSVSIASGGQLFLDVGGIDYGGAIAAGGLGTIETVGVRGALRFAHASVLSGPVTLTGNARFDAYATGDSGTLSGGVGDGGAGLAMEKTGAGTLTLSGANTYGGATIVAGGTLRQGVANAPPSGAGKGDLLLHGGVFDLNGLDAAVNGLGGAGTVDNLAATPVTFTAGLNDASSVFGGTVRNTGGTLSLTKVGAGTLTLSCASLAHAGPTTISAGTLRLQGPPAAPPGGMRYWLDASAAGSVVSDGSGYVSAWNDQSGNGLHFTQATAVNQPILVASGLNGRPVLRFDGNSDYLKLSSATAPRTVFAVNTPGGYRVVNGLWGSDSPPDRGIRLGDASNWRGPALRVDGADFTYMDGHVYVDRIETSFFGGPGTPHVLTETKGSAHSSTYNTTCVGWYRYNSERAYTGDVAEVIMYETILSDEDRLLVENYLTAKWLRAPSWMTADILPANATLTIAAGGTLDLGDVDQSVGLLTGTGTITNSGSGVAVLTAGQDGSSTAFAGAIRGAVSLTKAGAGFLSLSGDSTYGGGTVVSGGVLRVDSPAGSGTGTGAVTVVAGGTLGGTGRLTSAVTALSGAKFAAGNSVGTNTVGSLTLTPGSTFEVEADGATADQTISLGPVDLGGATLSTIEINPATFTSALILSNATGQITGYFAGLGESAPVMIGATMYFIHYRPTYVELNLSPTAVVLHQFGAIAEGAGVVVRWRTASEVRTAGFDLYRKAGDEWVKVNEAPIAATGAPQGGIGASYAVADEGAAAGGTYEYKLVETELDGTRREYGPYERTATAFEMTSPIRATPEGMEIRWLSRAGERYRVLRASELRKLSFEAVASGLEATPPENVFVDPHAAPLRVYRVELEE